MSRHESNPHPAGAWLWVLEEKRVLVIRRRGEDFKAAEGCDEHFAVTMTPDDMRALAAELVALSHTAKP